MDQIDRLKFKKILFLRLDKIGDLICTLPVDQVLMGKGFDVQWVISKGLGFIPDHGENPRKYIELDKNQPWESFKKLYLYIKEFGPDVAISFQSPWWVNAALWLARIKWRGGVLSQWHSFLFLNRGLRQKRSQALKHEADYNFELLKYVLELNDKKQYEAPLLHLVAPKDQAFLDQYQLAPQKYIVVHAGMAGSALNWPLEQYLEFINKQLFSIKVVLTGTSMDNKWVVPIEEAFKNNRQLLSLRNKLSGKDLLTLLAEARLVVAPSTGVLHIAAALGTPTVGIFSPIRVHHPRRWGARGGRAQNIAPDVICPEHFFCVGVECKNFDCMKKIEISNAVASNTRQNVVREPS